MCCNVTCDMKCDVMYGMIRSVISDSMIEIVMEVTYGIIYRVIYFPGRLHPVWRVLFCNDVYSVIRHIMWCDECAVIRDMVCTK